jgi:predicted transcriptional regulator
MASIMNEMRLCSGGLRKTRLMYRCNLSFGQLKVYLKLLYDKKFMTIVEANDGKMKVEVYRITQEGLAFLKSYNELRSHLAEERLTR